LGGVSSSLGLPQKVSPCSSVQMAQIGDDFSRGCFIVWPDSRPLTKQHGSPLVGAIENRRREPWGDHHRQLSQRATTVGLLGRASSSLGLISILPHHVPPRHHAVRPRGGSGAGGLVIVIVVVVVAQPPGQIQHHRGGQRWWRRARVMSQAAAATGGGGDSDRRVPLRLSVVADMDIQLRAPRSITKTKGMHSFSRDAPTFSSATFDTRPHC
jgi:hypothetical protein